MKNIIKFITLILLISGIILPLSVDAQSPEMMSYQAVVRDASNDLVENQTVGLQITILQDATDGTPVYSETHTPQTNANGLLTVEIGIGTTSDVFADIDWSSGPYFIKTEIDPTGGTTYTITGVSQLLSVPYALHAKTADGLSEEIIETDPVYGESIASGITADDTISWNDKFEGPESDPLFTESVAYGITLTDTAYWNNKADGPEIDPVFTESVASGITLVDTTSWHNKLDTPVGAQANDLISYDGTNWVAKNAVIGNSGGSQAHSIMQPYLVVNYIIALYGVYPSRASANPFIAEIIMFGGNFAPREWAFCDGQLLPISQNSALFSLLGTTFGGDGRTTFGLPDLRGRTPIHAGNGPGLSSRRIGEKGGVENVTLTIGQMPQHTHAITYE